MGKKPLFPSHYTVRVETALRSKRYQFDEIDWL